MPRRRPTRQPRRAPRRRPSALANLPTSMTAHSTFMPVGGEIAALADLGLVPPVVTKAIGFKDPLLGIPYWAYAAGIVGGVALAHFEKGRVEALTNYVTEQAEAASGAVTSAAEMLVDKVQEAGGQIASKTGEIVNTVSAAAKNAAFKAALAVTAREASPYADLILRVADEEKMSPIVLVAFGQRESRWGQALRPDGTGDHVARKGDWLKAKGVQVVNTLPAGWSAPKSGGVALPGPYAIPADGKGWGRGIMQIDWPRALADNHNWNDRYGNMKLGVKVYKEKLREITGPASGTWTIGADLAKKLGVNAGTYAARPVPANLAPMAAIAAYNAGSAAIRRAYSAAGQVGIDRVTTGGDYSSWVTNLIARVETAIRSAGGPTEAAA